MAKKIYLDILDKDRQEIFKKLYDLLGTTYYLAGGTALALQLRHRESVDFDLFRDQEITFAIKRKILAGFKGYPIQTLVDTSDELTLVLDKNIKITLLHYYWPPLFSLVKLPGVIPLLAVSDIATTKAYALGRRGNYRDYFDLYVIIKQKHATIKDIIKWCKSKYGEVFSERMFLEQLSYLEDIDAGQKLMFLNEKFVSPKIMADFFAKQIG